MAFKQLTGACDKEFHANTSEEIAEMSKKYGSEMFQQGDKEHLKAMEEMKSKMNNPDDFQKWMDQKKKESESLKED